MQYLKVEEYPGASYSRRASNSPRWTMRDTVASRSNRARRLNSATSSVSRRRDGVVIFMCIDNMKR